MRTGVKKLLAVAAVTLTLAATAGCSTTERDPNLKKLDYSVVPQVFAVIGDFGVGNKHEAAVAKMVHSFDPSQVLSVGDNAYKHKGYKRLVGQYYSAPIVAATGNHDYLMGISAFDAYFNPKVSGRNFVYQAASGVDFFILDSQAGLISREQLAHQKAWLTKKLAESTAKFKVVLFHHPPYSSGKHGSTKRYQWNFGALGVDLVISGHDHTYERIYRAGTKFIVDGTGGANLYKCSWNRVYGSKLCLDNHFGALFLYVNKYSVRGVFRGVSGRTLDTFTIEK